MIENHLKLCLVTNTKNSSFSLYKQFILRAIEGGITLIQFREKSQNLTQIRQRAFELKELLKPYKIPLIINDFVEIAKEIGADGVHLGQSDLSPSDARELLGPHKIIGLSIETFEELETANQLIGIDYIAASAVFPSQSKSNCKTIWGLEGLQKITQKSKHPVIAIGGITQNNVQNVIESGVVGVAVISAIHSHDNPKKITRDLIAAINQSIERKNHARKNERKN